MFMQATLLKLSYNIHTKVRKLGVGLVGKRKGFIEVGEVKREGMGVSVIKIHYIHVQNCQSTEFNF